MKSLSLLLLLLAISGLARTTLADTGFRLEIDRPMACGDCFTREGPVASGIRIQGGEAIRLR